MTKHDRWRNLRVQELCLRMGWWIRAIDGPLNWNATQALRNLQTDLEITLRRVEKCRSPHGDTTAEPATTDIQMEERGPPSDGSAPSSPIPSEAIALRRLGTKIRRLEDATK